MPKLQITYRTSANAVHDVETQDDVIKIGRDPTAQVLFDEAVDRMVSRNHAEIRWENGGWFCYPTPGKLVFRRGQEVRSATKLESGDTIEMAGVGGPSVTVRFGDAKPRPPADDTARTELDVRPLGLDIPLPVSPTMGGGILSDPSSFARGPISLAPKGHQGTEFLPALDAAKLLSQDVEQAPVPVQQQSRAAFRRAVILGTFVVVTFASFAGGWVMHSHEERRRLAVQRVLDLLSAQGANGVGPEVSEEDLKLFQEEVQAKHVAAPVNAKKLHVVKRKKGASEETVVVASDEAMPDFPSAPVKPAAPPPMDDASKKNAVRGAFAKYMGAQTIRLSAGTPRSHAAIEEMKQSVAHVKDAEKEYEETAKLLAPVKDDATGLLLRRTLRQLGECDALAPAKFLAEAKEAAQKIASDPGKKKHLIDALKHAEEHRYGPTITAALADQGLPVELFFIPYEQSAFEERFVGLPISDEIPKGMWGLLPGPAAAMGLHVGPLKASLDPDPNDDRQKPVVEVKRVASSMRNVFLGQAGGSTLLFMATWSNGDTSLLTSTKKRAGIKSDDTDPLRVNFWKVYDSGITQEMLNTALEYVATLAIAEQPSQFGFSFTRPLEHVSLADKE